MIMQTKSPHRPRLDLLRFPSDTGLRVALLIAAALGTSLFAYQWLSLGLLRTAFLRAAQACERVGGSISTVKACLQPAERMQAGLIMLGLVLLIGVAGAIFWAYPHMIIRRKRLMAYDPTSMPDLTATLAELFTQAQLSHPPRVLLDPLGRAGGWVFGRARARYLVLPGGLLATFLNDPAAFRAVVRHELAHLANRDVDLTFLSLSTWYAVGLVALAPLSLSLLAEVLRADAGPRCDAGMGAGAEEGATACGDGIDNDCDGFTDCRDFSCGRDAPTTRTWCIENTATLCNDSMDNDSDRFVDCDDRDCCGVREVSSCAMSTYIGGGRC
ncbi:MAG: hypothetical protein J0L92_11720 [Deltaproteobacteria bacterium]|nr:hypothetical protein [Deltaproteobacteria bacterium]